MPLLTNAEFDGIILRASMAIGAIASLRWDLHPGLSYDEMLTPTCAHDGCRHGAAVLDAQIEKYGIESLRGMKAFLKDKTKEVSA